MNNTFLLLVITGVALTVLVLLVKEPFLYLFGASDATYPYADSYITIYMFGSVFVMISLGMNGFINAQGFANKGMLTVLIGAVLNIVLDPIFIFALDMGRERRRARDGDLPAGFGALGHPVSDRQENAL